MSRDHLVPDGESWLDASPNSLAEPTLYSINCDLFRMVQLRFCWFNQDVLKSIVDVCE